jgi:hypothetical protein
MLFDADLLEHIRQVSREGVSSDDDRVIADLLLMHPEFDPIWNDPEVDPTKPREIGGEIVNPFVHIALHLIVGKQIRQGAPSQSKKAYLHLVERGENDHGALHLIMGWYGKLYFESVRRSDSFDEARYVQGLAAL